MLQQRKLQPELAELRKKHKGDPQKQRSQADDCVTNGAKVALLVALDPGSALAITKPARNEGVEIQKAAVGEGMRTLKQDGIEKVLQGRTDLAQVRAVAM